MDLTNISQIKSILYSHSIGAKKSLGQHFLISRDALSSIVKAANLSKKDKVLEIGPGLGVLTVELVEHAGSVLAVEFDPKMVEILETIVPAKNLQVVRGNVLEFNTGALPKGYKLVANVPYYITSPILRSFLEAKNKPREMVLLIQKEVAERITARPGNMSVLAVAVQFYSDPEIVEIVSKKAFWPVPKVDSAIVRLMVHQKPKYEVDEKVFFRIVKAGFGEKRKQLANALSGGLRLEKQEIIKVLQNLGLHPMIRAEELSLDDWYHLYQLIKEKLTK